MWRYGKEKDLLELQMDERKAKGHAASSS